MTANGSGLDRRQIEPTEPFWIRQDVEVRPVLFELLGEPSSVGIGHVPPSRSVIVLTGETPLM